jgi:hypothetical protein
MCILQDSSSNSRSTACMKPAMNGSQESPESTLEPDEPERGRPGPGGGLGHQPCQSACPLRLGSRSRKHLGMIPPRLCGFVPL